MSLISKLAFVFAFGAMVLGTSTLNAETKEKNSTKAHQKVQKANHKPCSVRFGGSAFPEPCDRVGEMPATAEPMRIIGKLPSTRDVR